MTLLFAGGDKRTLVALDHMKRRGFSVISYALPQRHAIPSGQVDGIVLPFPATVNGVLNAPLCDDPPTVEEFLRQTGIDPSLPAAGGPLSPCPFPNYTDLSLREDLKRRNGITTVEGAVDLMIRNTDRAIFGTPCLILGYGAIGKRLAAVLSALGANVTVAARKHNDRVDAELHGYGVQDTEHLDPSACSVIFNTVPYRLLTEEVLRRTEPDTVIFELASSPGGCDTEAALRLNRKIIPGPALPGKVAPVTAGEDLAKTLIDIFKPLQMKGSGTSLGT